MLIWLCQVLIEVAGKFAFIDPSDRKKQIAAMKKLIGCALISVNRFLNQYN
jgi:hypothetical protein